jgi:hypothetical protein
MVWGATQSPLETTPFESQRVARDLGLKVPAFDVQTGAADVFSQMLLLSRWREDEVPEYVLCVSASEASMHLDFSTGDERFFFGDGASAAIVSTRHSGVCSVLQGERRQSLEGLEVVNLDILGHLRADVKSFVDYLSRHDSALKKQLGERDFFAALGPDHFFDRHGYLLGAHTSAAFEDFMYSEKCTLETGKECLISLAGSGGGQGHIVIRFN